VQTPPLGPLGVHVSPKLVQLMHCWPFTPHDVGRTPGSHRLPKQHPEQLPGPHVGFWQKPFWQERPLMEQLEHVPPPAPHWVAELPMTQRLPEQHPGQLPGPHCCISIMHCCELGSQMLKPSARQFWQDSPPVPQDVVARPSSQPPLMLQQPLGQVKGSQLLGTSCVGTSFGASPWSSPPPSTETT
jgi:hypothetical protein